MGFVYSTIVYDVVDSVNRLKGKAAKRFERAMKVKITSNLS
jgi:hypothetical protein